MIIFKKVEKNHGKIFFIMKFSSDRNHVFTRIGSFNRFYHINEIVRECNYFSYNYDTFLRFDSTVMFM